jgi:hypothetical protein
LDDFIVFDVKNCPKTYTTLTSATLSKKDFGKDKKTCININFPLKDFWEKRYDIATEKDDACKDSFTKVLERITTY